MSTSSSDGFTGTLLIIGASRGLGHAIAAEFVKKGWNVVGTVIESERTMLHDLADAFAGKIQIEHLDMCEPDQIGALHTRLADKSFDVLFVNAGVAADMSQTVATVTTEDFIRIMVTNSLSPMRVIEAFEDLVAPTGTIGVMSSGQGSVANNESGRSEVYRSSKAALNQFMRSYAARHKDSDRPLLLMAPGWIKTALGGPNAPLTIEESIPNVVNVILAQRGSTGLKYLDYLGSTVPW